MSLRASARVVSSLLLCAVFSQCDSSDKKAKRSPASSSSAALSRPSSGAPASPSSSPPLAVNRAPTGEGDDFLLEVPKLTPDAPPAAAPAAAPRRECPLELAKSDTLREKLERLASSGEPCAQAALVSKLVAGRPSEGDFRRALRLASEAQDAGADVRDCFLFDFADDGPRLATCAERTGNALLSSLLSVSGFGVPRDLARARAILERDESRACGHDQVKAIIEAELAHPTAKRYAYCRDAACTSLEWERCYAERNRRNAWKSSALRDRLVRAASAHARDYERLLADFADFVAHDSKQVYLGADLLLASAKAATDELELERRFDALLERVLLEEKLPDATEADLLALQKRVHEIDRRLSKRKPASDSRAAERFVIEYLSAQKAYQKLEQRFVAFTTLVLGKDKERAARAALLDLRAETLEAASEP